MAPMARKKKQQPAKKKKRTRKPAARPAAHLRLRIICLAPPDPQLYGAKFGLQDNSSTAQWVIHEGAAQSNGDLVFECDCRVKPHARTGAPSFLGPFVHGSPEERFLYLSWQPVDWRPGTAEPSGTSCWVRRMKIHLRSISWAKIDKALKAGGFMVATLQGTGRDGGPACASVPLLDGGWQPR
jgi:uncharacterized protein DUF5990